MPVLERSQVELAVLRQFERDALSVEATREHVSQQLSARAKQARSQAERAAREVAELDGQRARVERDYRRGALSAENYERVLGEIDAEREAAKAERAQLAERAAESADAIDRLDAEHKTLQRLAQLRETIAGRVTDAADDVRALRVELARVFDRVEIVRVYADGSTTPPWDSTRTRPSRRTS
jgi:chromosome segregation ATPase